MEEEYSTLAGRDWGIREGFLEERVPEASHKRQMGINQAKKGTVFQAVGTSQAKG